MERIKFLESENKSLKFQLNQAKDYLEDEQSFLLEYERLMHFLTSFVSWSNESNKLLTKREKAELKKHDPKITKVIFERLALNPIAKKDREKNEALHKSLTRGDELARIKNLMLHLQKSLEYITSFKPKPQRNRPKLKQVAFHQWVKNRKIDMKQGLNNLVIDAEEDYKNGDLKVKIGRSTIRECLQQVRKK